MLVTDWKVSNNPYRCGSDELRDSTIRYSTSRDCDDFSGATSTDIIGFNDPRAKSRIFSHKNSNTENPKRVQKRGRKRGGSSRVQTRKGKKREVPREIERAARTCREILRISRL